MLDDPARAGRAARVACSRASCSSSTSSAAGSSRTRRSSARSPAAIPTASGSRAMPVHARRRCRPPNSVTLAEQPLHLRQRAFGYTQEDLRVLLAPMATPAPSRSARWATTPRSRCSPISPPLLFAYFKQLFAQVTNPPIDPIREEIVMSLATTPRHRAQPARPRRPRTPTSPAGPADPAQSTSSRRCVNVDTRRSSRPARSTATWPVADGRTGGSTAAIEQHLRRGRAAIAAGANIMILSDRRGRRRARRRSRRCWRSPPSTTTWSASARACAPGSSSSPASRARCTTSRR